MELSSSLSYVIPWAYWAWAIPLYGWLGYGLLIDAPRKLKRRRTEMENYEIYLENRHFWPFYEGIGA